MRDFQLCSNLVATDYNVAAYIPWKMRVCVFFSASAPLNSLPAQPYTVATITFLLFAFGFILFRTYFMLYHTFFLCVHFEAIF